MPAAVLRFPVRPGSSKTKSSRLFRIMIGSRQRWGTAPRSLHFSNALDLMPNSRANLASNFQSGRSGGLERTFIGNLDMHRNLSDLSSDVQQLFYSRVEALAAGILFVGRENNNLNEMADIRRRVKIALKAYRESRGWTQKQMADYLHIPLNSYESWETQPDRNIPTDIIARFCTYTDNDISWLMLGVKNPARNNPPSPNKRKAKPPPAAHA